MADWKQVESIVDQALQLPDGKRYDFVEEQCAGSKALKSEVTLLLESIDASEGWLNNPDDYTEIFFEEIAHEFEQISPKNSLIGQSVGAYTIQKELGEGGMGSVYLAERSDGAFEHQVAIKVIREGKATPDHIRRFEQERSILADLNHPGIAKLFDGGLTEEGYPYLIMEYIEGVPLTDYCRQHGISLAERLDLFRKVLEAIRHAHENAIIHRDLKPDNILVTPDGDIKVLDFGISKMLDDTPDTQLTQTKTRLLTPRYAAPEQIKQLSITTATDLYALGILFYQLICGHHPYEFSKATQYEMEQTILQGTVAPPSSRIQPSFAVASTDITKDLDAIALKALRKEPAQRYRMANEFLQDLNNFQQNLPVSALRDSYRYRSQKFVERYKVPLLTAASIFLLIGAMVAFYTWKLSEERNLAKTEAEKAKVVTAFLTDLFEANDPGNARGDTMTARQLLQAGEQQINALNGQPGIKSELLEVLGNIYGVLSYPNKSDSLLLESLSAKKQLYSGNDPELASIYYSLASTKNVLGEYELALDLLDTSITYQRQLYGSYSMEVGNSLRMAAENLKSLGNVDSAYQAIGASRTIFQSLGDTTGSDYLEVLMELAAVSLTRGDLKESEAIWRSSLELSNKLYDPPHPKILLTINGLANVLKESEDFTESEFLYRQSMEMTRQLYGKKHLNTATTMNNLAGLYYYTQEYSSADRYYQESNAILEEILGEDHPSVISTIYNQANLKADMGEFGAAETLYHQVLASDIEEFGESHPHVATDLTGLASLYKTQQLYSRAEKYFKQSLDIRRQVYDNPHHPYILYNKRSLAEIMVARGQMEKARRSYRELLRSFINTFGADHKKVATIAGELSKLMKLKGDIVSADSLITVASAPE